MRLARVSCLLIVWIVPAFAETDMMPQRFVAPERTSTTAAREYVPVEWQHHDALVVPSNLIVEASFRSSLETMISRSATFRRQCQRIAAARSLVVRIRRTSAPPAHGMRARTCIKRNALGSLTAEVEIPPLDDDIELVAHEIEHVIEQLDEVDLAAHAARPSTGVDAIVTDSVSFETLRAVRIGRLVAAEVRWDARSSQR